MSAHAAAADIPGFHASAESGRHGRGRRALLGMIGRFEAQSQHP
jgi:hypothetical protein